MFRICLQVTPPSPVVLATCPVIQFAVYQPFSLEYIHQHGIYTSIEVHSACAGSSLPSSTGLHQCGLGILSWFSLFICLTTPFLLLQILSIYCQYCSFCHGMMLVSLCVYIYIQYYSCFSNVLFQASCLPPLVADREQKLQFSLGCQVVLPPESSS